MTKQRNNVVVVLDIGDSKILCIIAKIMPEGIIEVLGYSSCSANGIKSGVIIDLKAASASIIQAVEDAESITGIRVLRVYVNIASNNLISHQLDATLDVSGHEINEKDMGKLVLQIFDKYESQQVDIIHSFIYDYAIDGSRGIISPLGMYGKNLVCEVNALVCPSNTVANLNSCISKCQFEISGYIASSYASGIACLSDDEMKLGVVLLEIGSGCSAISIFANGQLVFTDSLAIGGHHITNDIAKGFGISLEEAERLKILYGALNVTDDREKIEIQTDDSEEFSVVSKKVLCEIIQARLEEILELLNQKLINAGFSIAGHKLIVVGGTSALHGIKEMVAKLFAVKVKLGTAKAFVGLEDEVANHSFVTAIGMLEHLRKTSIGKSATLNHNKFSGTKIWQWIKENFI